MSSYFKASRCKASVTFLSMLTKNLTAAKRGSAPQVFRTALRLSALLAAVRTPTKRQGLTPVHFSAQRERLLWNRGCN